MFFKIKARDQLRALHSHAICLLRDFCFDFGYFRTIAENMQVELSATSLLTADEVEKVQCQRWPVLL